MGFWSIVLAVLVAQGICFIVGVVIGASEKWLKERLKYKKYGERRVGFGAVECEEQETDGTTM